MASAMGGAAASSRRRAVDATRGLVMVVMALDHLRDFLGNAHHDATDLAQTTIPVFLSRWITHFCAPTFFLLAGVSAYLSIQSGRRSVGSAARFLALRGLALVAIEQTVLRCLGWYCHFDYHFMNAGVLYGLGLSMVLMAGLLWLPPPVSVAVGLAIAVVYSYLAFGAATWLVSGPVIFWDTALPGSPASYGFDLGWVWVIWAGFVAALYPACRWFAAVRRSRRTGPATPA